MPATDPLRPAACLLPWAGTWAKLVADAVETGLSNSERNDPEIAAALEALRQRTAQRVLSGETRPEDSWDTVIAHLTVLLCRPEWMPTHALQPEQCRDYLKAALWNLERLCARASMSPNVDAIVTRAALRLLFTEVALFLSAVAKSPPASDRRFEPWKPKEGLGRVIRDLWQGCQPRVKREDLIEELRLSPPVWDRLLQGQLPATAGFDFDGFAALVGGDAATRHALAGELRRAFVACRLIQQFKQTIDLGTDGGRFWSECWPEVERVRRVAAEQPSAAQPGNVGQRTHQSRELALRGARGFWVHTLQASGREWDVHLETVANAAAVAAEQEANTGIKLTDEVVLVLLNRYARSAPARQVEAARAAYGTPEAVRLLSALPPTPGRQLSLGREFMQQGDLPSARLAFEQAYEMAPNNWDVVSDLAWFEARYGNGERALSLLAGDRFSSQPNHHFVLGETLFRLGRHAEALTAFHESISRQHGLGHAYGRMAQCCHALGRKPEAQAHAKTCARLTGHDPLQAN